MKDRTKDNKNWKKYKTTKVKTIKQRKQICADDYKKWGKYEFGKSLKRGVKCL